MTKKPTYEELVQRIQELEQAESERKQTGEALRESEERFRSVFENSGIGIVIVDRNGRYQKVNQAMSEILGYTQQELLSMGVQDTSLPGEPDQDSDIVRQIWNGEINHLYLEKRYIHKDGHVVWGDIALSSTCDAEGKVLYIVGQIQEITERKRAEETLLKERDKARSYLDIAGVIIVILNADQTVALINKKGCEILGFEESEVVGTKWFDKFIPERDRERTRTGFFELIAGNIEPIEYFENYVLTKDNTEKLIAWHNTVLQDEKGNIVATLSSGDDITKSKLSEDALKESEQRYRQIYNIAPAGIWEVDFRTGKLVDVNNAVCEYSGYTKDELLSMNGIDLLTEESQKRFLNRISKLLSGASVPDPVDYEIIRKDGSVFWASISNRYIYEDENIVGSTVVAIDITERKQAEDALQTSHERFLTVLESIDATIYVADMETHEILFMNKYMIESFGRDMTGDICWDVFRGESEPCRHCANDKLIDENGIPTGVFVWQGKNPITEKWYINHDRAIEWTDGRLVRLQIATDITKLKSMEEELRQAQKMESIGTLAGGIAHDFNNILFPIIGHAEMLFQDLPEGSPLRNSIDSIYTAALRARNLVKQILTFSRQGSTEIKLMKIQPIIKEALKLVRSTIPTSIEIKQYISNDCGIIKADPTQIHQIVINLATNAYHAIETTGGEVKVNLKEIELSEQDVINPEMEPGPYACLTIADTGIGMDKNLIEKIFDPFFTTKKNGKGTGMGLSVVHGIVKSAGGIINVSSEPGKGTEIDVYLPVEKSSSEHQEIQTKEPIQSGTERILLVDDEDAIITVEKQMLERLGYQVISRVSSIEALETFRTTPDKFDIVITDMAMPNMSGDKLASELIKIRPDIPILICTGFSERMSEEKAAAMGIKNFLMKPIVMKDLSKIIRDVLDNK